MGEPDVNETLLELKAFIANDPTLTRLLREAEKQLGEDPGHDVAHCLRVALWTMKLGGESVDRRCAIAAALLHDVVNLPKDSPERADASRRSAEVARALLRERDFAPAEIDLVAEAILTHSFSLGLVPRSPLGDALQDADRLEALGALGILRTASCGARMGASYFEPNDPWAAARPLDDRAFTIDHFFCKLLHLAATMRTEAGRREALKRRAFMVGFLNQLGEEIGATPPQDAMP